MSASDTEVEREVSPPVDKDPKPKVDGAVERAVLDILRQAKKLDFWNPIISVSHRPWALADWLNLEGEAKVPQRQLVSALKKVRKEYRSFTVKVSETQDRYNPSSVELSVDVELRDGFEWKDAWEEAWSSAAAPNPHCLSDNALRLFLWAKGPKNTGRLTERRKIGAQAALRHTYDHIEAHLREIQLKADAAIRWEYGEKGWRAPIRVWFEKGSPTVYDFGPLNPTLGLKVATVEHRELGRFRDWMHAEILKPGFPEGVEVVGIFDIRDRKTVMRVFGSLPTDCGDYGPLREFFEALRLVDGVTLHHDFEEGGGPWLLTCQPCDAQTWKDIKTRLDDKAAEIPFEKKYSLGEDARALLRWILDLRSDERLLEMTPVIEEHLVRDIGIEVDWEEENLKAYLEVLAEEINERTEFNLRTIPWHHCGRVFTRMLVKKKRADLNDIVQAIQRLGLSRGRLLDEDRVKAAIEDLTDS